MIKNAVSVHDFVTMGPLRDVEHDITDCPVPRTCFDKPLLARFGRPHTSSAGGAVPLNAPEKVYGLVAGFEVAVVVGCTTDL